MGGAVNVGGPPIVLYLYLQPWRRDAIRATLVVFFCVISALKVGLTARAGLFPADIRVYLLAVPLIWIGGYLGLKVGDRLDRPRMSNIATAALSLFGALLIIQG